MVFGLDEAVRSIMASPETGEPKRGDLAGVRVFKFKAEPQLYLLAYGCDGETLSLYAWGVHENFYTGGRSPAISGQGRTVEKHGALRTW